MKTMKLLAVAAALLLSASTVSAQSLEDAQNKYTEGMMKLKEKDLSGGAVLLEEAMNMGFDLGDEGLDLVKEIQKVLPKVYFQAGLGELKTGNYDGAVSELQTAFELADLYGDVTTARQASRAISAAYQTQGATAFNEKNYEAALVSFSKGYEQDPTNIKLALLTAKTYAELNKLDTALVIYNDVIATGERNSKFEAEAAEAKEDVNTYVLLAASAAAEAKDLDKVLELAKLAPSSPEAALMSMQVANNLKNYNVIIENAETAAAVQVDDAKRADIYYMLGVAYNNIGQHDKAVVALGKVTAGGNVAAAKTLADQLKK